MVIYLLLSIVIIAATPWPEQFERYFSPLVPLLAIAFIQGIVWTKQQVSRSKHTVRRQLASAGLALVTGFAVASVLTARARNYVNSDDMTYYVDARGVEHPYRLVYHDKAWRDFETALSWLRNHAPAGSVVASTCPYLVYLKMHSKSVMPPKESDVDREQRLLDGVPVTFLMVDDLYFSGHRDLHPIVAAYGERWEEVYTVPSTTTAIYQRTTAP